MGFLEDSEEYHDGCDGVVLDDKRSDSDEGCDGVVFADLPGMTSPFHNDATGEHVACTNPLGHLT